MGKAPAFQFYVKDWLSDSNLRMVCHSTKGIWVDLLCYMWDSPERGVLTFKNTQHFARFVGANNNEIDVFLSDAKDYSFCDICVTDNGKITVCNRRMFRDEKDRKNNKMRQRKHREKRIGNEKITPPSPTPSPTPKKKLHTSNRFDEWWNCYPKKVEKKKCLAKWKSRRFDDKADLLISDVKRRIKEDRKWLEGFIPNPLTYINGDRWDDEIEKGERGGNGGAVMPEVEQAVCGNCKRWPTPDCKHKPAGQNACGDFQ